VPDKIKTSAYRINQKYGDYRGRAASGNGTDRGKLLRKPERKQGRSNVIPEGTLICRERRRMGVLTLSVSESQPAGMHRKGRSDAGGKLRRVADGREKEEGRVPGLYFQTASDRALRNVLSDKDKWDTLANSNLKKKFGSGVKGRRICDSLFRPAGTHGKKQGRGVQVS